MSRASLVAVLLVALPSGAGVAASPAERCTAAKLRTAERLARGLVKCETRAVLAGGAVDPSCVLAARSKFMATWTKLETSGRCLPGGGDEVAIQADVEAFVDHLRQQLAPTPTTTTSTPTTTTSCPPPTALYCGVSGCAPLPALCPSGTACTTIEEGCGCIGETIPCGDSRLGGISGNFCRWGECPIGMTCTSIPKSGECGFDCGCQ